MRTPNNSPDLVLLPEVAQPHSGLDKTTQPLWLRGALHRHGLSQMDRWSPSDPYPQPVQGRPSQHTVPGSPIVNTGVPNTGAPCSQCRALSSHPQSLQQG